MNVREWPIRILAEGIGQNPKTAWGVAETVGRLFGGQVINEEGAERLILALGGIGGLKEDLREIVIFLCLSLNTLPLCQAVVASSSENTTACVAL